MPKSAAGKTLRTNPNPYPNPNPDSNPNLALTPTLIRHANTLILTQPGKILRKDLRKMEDGRRNGSARSKL